MKKVIILSVVAALLLIGLIVYSDLSNRSMAAGNPYGKETLHPATVEQLKDPLNDNQIVPHELEASLQRQDEMYVYFYSPLCNHCQRMTPILVPLAKQLKIDVKKLNVLEFPESWRDYKIEGTPTLIHFKAGKEVSRLVGEHPAAEIEDWFRKKSGSKNGG